MIVNCPSCQTRYRAPLTGSGARRGRCSRCEETFEIVPGLRQYRVLPFAASAVAAPGGDPFVAAASAEEMVVAADTGRAARVGADRRSAREWFGLMLLTALGAAAGFQAAVVGHADPLTSIAAGTLGGLVLGWSWIRTAERKR